VRAIEPGLGARGRVLCRRRHRGGSRPRVRPEPRSSRARSFGLLLDGCANRSPPRSSVGAVARGRWDHLVGRAPEPLTNPQTGPYVRAGVAAGAERPGGAARRPSSAGRTWLGREARSWPGCPRTPVRLERSARSRVNLPRGSIALRGALLVGVALLRLLPERRLSPRPISLFQLLGACRVLPSLRSCPPRILPLA
jgi:hypothetical protein